MRLVGDGPAHPGTLTPLSDPPPPHTHPHPAHLRHRESAEDGAPREDRPLRHDPRRGAEQEDLPLPQGTIHVMGGPDRTTHIRHILSSASYSTPLPQGLVQDRARRAAVRHALPPGAPLARLEIPLVPLYLLTSRHTNPYMDSLLQVRRWPAWKCVHYVVGLSHPGTPTPLCRCAVGPPGIASSVWRVPHIQAPQPPSLTRASCR